MKLDSTFIKKAVIPSIILISIAGLGLYELTNSVSTRENNDKLCRDNGFNKSLPTGLKDGLYYINNKQYVICLQFKYIMGTLVQTNQTYIEVNKP